MKQAMIQAAVGDDVMGEDPSVNALERHIASMFGKEAAVFCPSGTMTNQIGLMLHTRPGDEVICDALSHIYLYEGGGMAANAGIQPRLLAGNQGKIRVEQIKNAINPDDPHKARTALVSLENTHNRGGGSCYPLKEMQAISAFCAEHALPLHLDGARIFNALVHTGITPTDIGALFDTISVCLSKGLGAPVGSVLLGTEAQIHEAKRLRKRLGGGMRQSGMLAAAGLYALEHHVVRLEEDHQLAKQLYGVISQYDWISSSEPPETNILIFEIATPLKVDGFLDHLKHYGILAGAIGGQGVRMVTHLDIPSESEIQLTKALDSFAGQMKI